LTRHRDALDERDSLSRCAEGVLTDFPSETVDISAWPNDEAASKVRNKRGE
jgi:hypothetical protein